jgi:hypothetical protein
MKNIKNTPSIARSSFSLQNLKSLAAPDVKVAFHDSDNFGLIPVVELDSPITVDLTVWEAAKPNYTYRLLWDGNATGPEKPITDDHKPGDTLTLEIPTDLLTEGKHTVAYQAYSPFSNIYEDSDSFSITIDRTAPGKPELGAIQFPVEVQNGLTLSELIQLGSVLTVEIASYTGMAKHDTIHTYWGEKEGPTASVGEDDMGLNKIIFDFTRDFLESVEKGPQPVKYHVVDRAGNVSAQSLSVDILLLLQEVVEDYPAPILEPAVGNLIDYAEAQSGVKVDIPSYPGPMAGDEITFYWGANAPMQPVALPPGHEGDDVLLSLVIDFDTISVVPTGVVALSYSVTRDAQLIGTSLEKMVEVFLTLPIPVPAEAPIIQGTSASNPNLSDNFIDEDDYEFNARAIVKWSSSFKENDDINLFWGEQYRAQWYQIKAEDVIAAKDLTLPIANSIMQAQGTGVSIPVLYSTIRNGNPNESRSPVQLVTVRSKESLPGGPEGLEGPPFNLTPSGFLSPWMNENGADLIITPYTNIAENQKLFFIFKGFDENNILIESTVFTATRELDDLDVVNGYTFTVPYNVLRTVCYGFAEASFRVEPASGSNQSAVTSTVTRVPVEMRKPSENSCPI